MSEGKPSVQDSCTKSGEKESTQRREWSGRAVADVFNEIGEYQQFETIPKDVCLDPYDEDNNFLYTNFRSKDGSRLSKEIVENEFILVGNDKCGLSAVLDIPVPPGGTLSAQISTWCNPCHSGLGVEHNRCFGVGMVPVGSAQDQQWTRGGIETVIEDGVQYYAELAIEKMMFDGPGGFGGMASLLTGRGGSTVESTFDVMSGGTSIHHDTRSELGLDVIDMRIQRHAQGSSEFRFVHGGESRKVERPADQENKDMQLFFSCLGWADNNNTHVQIHRVVLDVPLLL